MSPRASFHSPIRRRSTAIVILGSLLLGLLAVPGSAAAATYRDCSGLTPAAGADLHRCDLTAADLIGQDLHGINLARARLVGINAGCDPDEPRTNLAAARIYRADLTGALLCDAILNGADLHRSNLTNASLEDATLPGANLARADMDGVTAGFALFRDATLARVTWRNGGGTGAIFEGADLPSGRPALDHLQRRRVHRCEPAVRATERRRPFAGGPDRSAPRARDRPIKRHLERYDLPRRDEQRRQWRDLPRPSELR